MRAGNRLDASLNQPNGINNTVFPSEWNMVGELVVIFVVDLESESVAAVLFVSLVASESVVAVFAVYLVASESVVAALASGVVDGGNGTICPFDWRYSRIVSRSLRV